MSSAPGVHHPRPPSFKQYVLIAAFLFAITIVEFVIILPEGFRGKGWTIAPLAILSAIKFAAVIFFYMHLKFDNRLLTWIFMGGLVLGFGVTLALVGLFGTFTPSPRAYAEANAVAYHHAEHAEAGDPHSETPAVPEPESPPDTEPAAPPAEAETAPAETAPVETASAPAGGALAAQGQEIFITGIGEGAATACGTCHTIEGLERAVGLLGPDLTHIATDAATRQAGVSARDYLVESIKAPESFVAEGVERATPGLMTTAITSGLTDADVEALVVFLLEQK